MVRQERMMAERNLRSAEHHSPPLTVDAARLRAIAAVAPLVETERLPLEEMFGRVLAEAPQAATDLPPFDNSAMDGYAVRRADLAGEAPFQLSVSERIHAGDARGLRLSPGTAAQIDTGAPIPQGADAVLMQERVTRSADGITATRRPEEKLNIRQCGEDRHRGEMVLPQGCLLTAPRLALLAGCGVKQTLVHRKLKVGLFSAGSELREPGMDLEPGQIYNSNRVLLRAMLDEPWVQITDYGILPDDAGRIRRTLRHAAAHNDVVISSGGVSAGEEDHVLDALKKEDATLDVLKVAIRPGKPLTIGRIADALYVGLPGNPYAVAITFSQIARPALCKAAGLKEQIDTWIPAVSGFDYVRTTGRREFVPVTWDRRDAMGRPILACLGRGASASLGPIAMAQGIAIIEPDMQHVTPGVPLAVEPLL